MSRPAAWFAASACCVAIACFGSTEPNPPLTLGEFALERVDGQPLPVQLTVSGGPCTIVKGSLELFPDTTLILSADCSLPPVPPQNIAGFAYSMPFRQVAVDSFQLFSAPPGSMVTLPFAFGKQAGDIVTVRTVAAAPMIGAHELIFRRSHNH
jgi:hypothetical protein